MGDWTDCGELDHGAVLAKTEDGCVRVVYTPDALDGHVADTSEAIERAVWRALGVRIAVSPSGWRRAGGDDVEQSVPAQGHA